MFFSSNIPAFDKIYKKSGIESVDLLSSWIEDSDLVNAFSRSDVVKKAEEIAQRYSDFSEISYIGVAEGPFKGVARTDLSRQIIENILNKVYESKQNWEELSESERQMAESVELKAEKLLANNELVAVEINPSAIIEEADKRYENLSQEMENKNITIEDLGVNQEKVWADITTLILAETIAHEGKHGEGGSAMQGEGQSEVTGAELWQATLENEFPYLAEFESMIQQ